jgi:hypothetical protein
VGQGQETPGYLISGQASNHEGGAGEVLPRLSPAAGSLRLMCQMTGLYELIGAVKASNPRVEIAGC